MGKINHVVPDMHKYLAYLPGFPKAPKKAKIILTAAIALLCLFLLIPVSYKHIDLVKQAMEYSPAEQAQRYYDAEGPKAAFDFVTFYDSLPGVTSNPELAAIKKKAESDRSSLVYIGKEIGLGVLGLNTHENYGKYVKSAVKMVPYVNDVQSAGKYANELIQEYSNYRDGKNIDTLHLGVAALGLIEVAIGLLPGDNATINKLKAQTNALLDSLKLMNSKLRDTVANVLRPALKSLEDSDLAKEKDGLALLNMIREKSGQFMGILDQAEAGLNNFQGLANLERKNRDLSQIVAASSSDFKELDENSAIAEEIAKLNPNVLLYGGLPRCARRQD